MAWQPPEDELDSNVLKQSKPPEDESVKNIPNQWSPPKAELVENTPDQWSPPEDELDNSPTKIKDAGTLQQMKQSGQELTREQERILFDAEDKKEFTQKASEAVTTFVPTAIDIAKQLGTGAGEFLYKGVLKPIDSMSQSPEEAEKTWKEAKNTWRSGVSGVAGDIQETSDALVRFSMFGSSITDKLLGKSNDERFEKYMLREGMRQFAQKVYADDPDNAARLLAENPLLQKLASAATLAQGATPEEAELAKKAYEELVKEQGLTKDEINENVSMLGEILSPISLPGTNRITNTFAKATGKVTRKAGELALRGVVAPLAKGVAKTAGGLESGIEKIQSASRKIGEYAVGDPDTFVKTATNTIVGSAKLPAKMTRGIATTIGDVAGQAGLGRRGMFELAGRASTSGELTKKLFGPQALGGKGRARVADWAVRQSNAIIQPAVNGAVLNVALGLPDIETARDLGYSAGVGAGIGAYGGARLMERGGALIDPTTGLAEKIDAIVTPDPSQLRKDEDADIQRFIKTADPTLMSSIDELSNVNNIKSALDLKIKNLEAKKVAQINKDDERRIQDQIDNFAEQRKALDKSTPQTEAEIKRQVQLSFTDAMDLAKTTGAAAGLNNIQVKVLRPDQMDDFYRNLYGKTLTDAESVVQQLVGNPRLSPSEKEMLGLADQTIKQYLQDVAGSSTARGFAISEQTGKPNHLKMQNQTGATVVINGDLVTQMGRDGLNLGRVINHEMQHALSNFQEVRDMIAPIRKELFDQKVINADGTFEVVKKGVIPDSELDKFALQYAAAMDASGGASFLSNFANQDQLRNYMKEEYLSELAGLSGGIQGNLRGNLDSVGRSVVDWIESRTKNGALKRVKEALRNYGVIVDDQGQFSSVIGGELNPEALAMMRRYQRGLRDLNESLVYNSDPIKDEAEIPLTVFSTNRALQQRYKDSEFFEQQQVVKMTTPDGQTQEIVIPPNVKVDSFISDYRFANGQLVDELGNVISLGPDIPLQAMPDGTSLSVDTRIARNADGSPRIISPRESKRRAKKRGEAIRKAIDEAPEDASGVRLEDTGNGNYRGTLSPTQVAAINALPNDLVAPSLKRKIAFFNEILGRKDGSIVEIEYQAAIRDKKYRALQPQMRTEIPFGFQFDKQGNFLMTTMSMSRMHDKANAWAAKRPRNLRLWGGDMTKFWDSVRQYLYNHKQGLQGHIGLNPDPEIAMEMKNRINDLFNVYRKETRDANPERTTLPKRKGQDSRDVVIRSRRMDRINSYDETALAKMPFSYELAVKNYLPAENPLAELQSPEQFAQAMEIDTELTRLAAQGNVEPLELQLHQQDLLHPAEYIDVENGKLRVRSMFDPTQAIFDPMESEPEVSVSATQFMPAETERYPTSERGMYSGLQKTIDEKVTGKFASPDQLKAMFGEYISSYIEEQPDGKEKTIVVGKFPVDLKGKAQDAIANKNKGMVAWQSSNKIKEEELKWSGVLGEIDRLAAENQGKVPKDKVMDYLRNEGAVKFEEVTLGGATKTWTQSEIDALERQAQRTRNWDAYEQAVLEFEDQQLGSNANQTSNETRFAKYQLPGGANYREVVMTMPDPKLVRYNELNKIGATYMTDEQFAEYKQLEKSGLYKNQYTSSHFPDTPNYVAHMRLNERTDAQGNDGLFVEEWQSDRHQAGREKGYLTSPKGWTAKQTGKAGSNLTWSVFDAESNLVTDGMAGDSAESAIEYAFKRESSSVVGKVPDAPFRKDWSLQLFKRALRDAVESGKQWIGWTTGETQAERYDLSKQISSLEVRRDGDRYIFNAYDINGNDAIQDKGVPRNELADVVGKDLANKIISDFETNDAKREELRLGMEAARQGMKIGTDAEQETAYERYKTLQKERNELDAPKEMTYEGDNLKIGGEGMKGFYDQILPKEVGKYVAKMGGKVEKVDSGIMQKGPDIDKGGYTIPSMIDTPIWRVNITPEMAGKVRSGQLQFMPADTENIKYSNPPSEEQAIDALSSNKRNFFGMHRDLEDGYPVGLRIDIPAFTSKGVYVVTVHEKKKGAERGSVGDRIGYDTIAKVDNPVFFSNEVGAKKIKSGESNKFPVATVEGEFNSSREIPEDINDWTPVGYNPKDHSYFYDKTNEEPVLSGDEAISVGNTVFVKNPVYGNKANFAFMPEEQPTKYEPISARIRPLEGISAPTKVVGAKALSLGEIEPPVRGKAILPDMELKPDISEKSIQSSDKTGLQFMPAEGEELFGNPSEEFIEQNKKKTYWDIKNADGEISISKTIPWDEELNKAIGNPKYTVTHSKSEDGRSEEYQFNNANDAIKEVFSIIKNKESLKENKKQIESVIENLTGNYSLNSKFFDSAKIEKIGSSSKSTSEYYRLRMKIKPEYKDIANEQKGVWDKGFVDDDEVSYRIRFADHENTGSGPSNDFTVLTRGYRDQKYSRLGIEDSYGLMAKAIENGDLWNEISSHFDDKITANKPVQDELPRATGLQFMPASPVTKTQTGYDYTYLDEALKNGKNGKVALTRPIKPTEALPLLSQRVPITNEVDKDSFDYKSQAAVILYNHNGKPVTFKYDPQLIRKPQFKDISVEHAGKVVQLAMADRHTASGGDMGGPIHPWLKSLEEVEIYDPVTGQYLIGKWANNEWKPAKSMKDKSRAGATDLLVYTMDKESHGSNLRSIRIISNEIDNANLTQPEKDAFLVIANKAVKTYRLSDQNSTIDKANKSIEEIKIKLKKETDKNKISKLNDELNSELKRISTAEEKIKNYKISQDENDFSAIVRNYKSAMTRYQNKTGSEEIYRSREKELKDYIKTPAFKKLQKEVKGVKMINLDNTFDGRKAAEESLKGLTINKFNIDHVLPEISDFENGGLHHFVASVELSKNPNLMAVYLGDDPNQAKFMTQEEAAAAKIFKANPNFVIHEAYSWLMLGPKNGNDFLNTNPKTHLDYFPWFKQQWANLKTDPAARDRILKLGNDNLMNTMRDQKSIPLVMPKK